MRTRLIGDVPVSAVGLGAMPLSIEGRPDEARAIATIHAALDARVTLIDTADSYHWHAGEIGHNERLIARALASYGGDVSGVLVATKGGRGRPGDGSWTVNGDPRHIRRACEASVQNRYSPAVRDSEAELRLCTVLGVAFLPWSPSAASPAAPWTALWTPTIPPVGRRST